MSNKKDAYYFSHDCNAQDDPKCMTLIDQMGMEGYGIFWGLIEKLRAEKDFMLPLSVCNPFAKRWGTSREKVETVIKNYGLFVVEDDKFFSLRLLNSMTEKSERARKSALYRWGNANALQLEYNGSANGMQKDAIKGKESKGKESKKKKKGGYFFENQTKVVFDNGDVEDLTAEQTELARQGKLKPRDIIKFLEE
jgi:hypothetical protein